MLSGDLNRKDIQKKKEGIYVYMGLPGGLVVKNSPAKAGDLRDAGSISGQEDPLEEGMATHSSMLAWSIPWTEGPGGLQSTGS